MDYFEKKYIEANEKFEYLMRKMVEITYAPYDQIREIAWEAVLKIYDDAFKPLETEPDKEVDAA